MKQSAHKMEGGVGRCLRGVGGRRQSTEARGEGGTCPTCDEPNGWLSLATPVQSICTAAIV